MTDRRRRLEQLSPAQRALLERRLAERRAAADGPRPGQAGEGPFRPSFSQERFWFLQQLGTRVDEYHISGQCRLRGPLDRSALERAVALGVARHAGLRSRFPAEDGRPRLVIEPDMALPLVEHAAPDVPPEARDEHVRERARRLHRRPFDLARGPLLRLELIVFDEADHGLCVTQHHILSDGVSFGLLMAEFTEAYNAFASGRSPDLPDLPLRLVDHAHWQRQRLDGPRRQELLDHWRAVLDGAPPQVALPSDHPRPTSPTHAGATLERRLPAELERAARDLARARGATLFTVLMAGFQAWLHRLADQTDLVVGTSVARRERPEVAGLVGPLLNSVPVRTRVDPAAGFDALVDAVQRSTREALAWSELPFELLVEALAPDRDPAAAPLFNVFCDMAAPEPPRSWQGLEVTDLPIDPGTASFDLSWMVLDRSDGLRTRLCVNTDLFDAASLPRLERSLRRLLADALAHPGRPVQDLALLDEEQRHELLVELQPPACAYDRARSTPARLADSAARHAGRTALVEGGRELTHGALDARAAALARRLRAAGVAADVPVAVVLPRCSEVLVALLAIWKAGGVYVPLDPADPDQRLADLLDALAPAVVLARPDQAPRLADLPGQLLTSDTWPGPDDDDGPPPLAEVSPDDLAYVIHTSGSTGQPKGVMIPHGALTHHVAWVARAFDLSPDDRLLLRTPLGFDASLWELVHPLVAGATLVVAPEGLQRDPAALLELAADERISVVQTVPSMLTTWLEQPAFDRLTHLRHLICAGEALVPELVARLAEQRRRHGLTFALHNLYGPSEATVDTTLATVDLDDPPAVSVPIGRPMGNTRVLVLDRRGRLLPRGALGELAIAGDGLARGYLGRPDLTAERFVEGPDGVGRVYLTGDLGRWDADGQLRYAGRVDSQVKLHGQRIEPGEVEAVLTTHPDLRQAVVGVDDDGAGQRRLVAWVVPRPGAAPDPAELRAFLAARLPRAMVPSAFVELDELPLNRNEKVDRRALPSPPREAPAAPSTAPVSDALRADLCATVAELLGRQAVGPDDDFFALGGHSLLAARLAARVAERHGRQLPLMPFFERPTVETLARLLEAPEGDDADGGPLALPRPARLPAALGPASAAQERLWFLSRLDPGSREYHVCGALELTGPLDVDALSAALDGLRDRHEALRTTLRHDDTDGLVQVVGPPAPWPLERRDLSVLPPADQPAAVAAAREQLDAPPYDLERGPLVRGLLLALADDRHVLVLGLHHLVCDAASLDRLLRELGQGYAAARDDTSPPPAPPLQPVDLAAWQRRRLDPARRHALAGWWRQTLAGAPRSVDLPGDVLGPPDDDRDAWLLERPLPDALLAGCQALAAERGATLFAVLLAAFDAWLLRLTGQGDLVVATTVDQRDRAELAGLVGLAVHAVPLRVDLSDGPGFGAAVDRAGRAVGAALAHAELPFEGIIEAVAPERDRRRPPLVNLSFDLLEALPLEDALPGLSARPLPADGGAARLDLSVVVERRPQGAVVTLECRRSLLGLESLGRLWDAFEQLLAGLLAAPDQPLDRVPWLTPDEAAAVAAASHGPSAPPPAADTVPGLLALQPDDRPALRQGSAPLRLTHGELTDLTGRCAAVLAAAGVVAGDRVALDLPRSPGLLATLLACWSLGASWMPLDPGDPPARRAAVLADGRPRLVVTSRAEDDTGDGDTGDGDTGDGDTGDGDDQPPRLDLATALASPLASAPTPVTPDPDAPAYLLHTSGSTGRPKGVVVPHRALAHVLGAIARDLAFAPGDVILQRLPLSFDAALLELLAPLVAGAEVVLVDDASARDPAAVAALIGEHRATMLQAVPGFLAAVLDETGLDTSSVRRVGCGGEALPVELLRRLRRRLGPDRPVVNMYGPTEATIQATSHHCREDEPDGMPIGRPLPGVVVRVLDRHGGLVPRGVVGELCVGGAGLSDGYLERPEDTAAAFVDDPHGPGRLYRTGDLGRLRGDGLFEWAGRADQQLKLGGRRVEPGEVEARLAEHPAVLAAAVVPGPGGASLVGHVVADEQDLAAVRAWLLERLPAALVPSRLVAHRRLPLGPTGKLDREALRRGPTATTGHAPGAADEARHDQAGDAGSGEEQPGRAGPGDEASSTTGAPTPDDPGADLTARLGALCGELLGRAPLAADEDFFLAGGHSLLALRLAEAVQRRLGRELPVAAVFDGPTPAALARRLEAGGTEDDVRSRLRRDAQLADDVRPGTRRALRPPRRVLLTGATGFLGAHLLARLLAVTDARVHCLVRAADAAAGRRRLDAVLARYRLPAATDGRVVVHPADLAAPRLGLDEATWQALAADTDLVLHCGAAVDFLAGYERLRAANVESTRALLELACASGAVFQLVSTLGVVTAPDRPADRPVDEHLPLDDLVGVEGGYEQTKWVAEALVREAGRRGLVVGVHRPGRLSGSVATGAWNTDDVASRLLAAALVLGLGPDTDGAFDLTPVDFAAAAIVALALDPAADGATTHLFQPRPPRLATLFERAAARGLATRPVSGPAWRAAVADLARARPDHPLARLEPLLAGDQGELSPDPGLGSLRGQASAALLARHGLACPPADAAHLDGWLEALRDAGLLDALPPQDPRTGDDGR